MGGSPLDQPVPLVVRDLAAGEEVRIAGLTLGGYVDPALLVQDCLGPVVLSDISGGSFTAVYDTPGLGQVRRSDQVLLDGCELRVIATNQLAPPTPGLSVPTPALPVLVGAGVLVQAATAGPSGTTSLSAPSFLGLR